MLVLKKLLVAHWKVGGKMTDYLRHLQQQLSSIIYEPHILCTYCGNERHGDSPTIKIKECDLCEERDWQSSCCTAKPFGNSFIEEEKSGICSKCYDGASFEDLNKEE
jgi:hypothetical protein